MFHENELQNDIHVQCSYLLEPFREMMGKNSSLDLQNYQAFHALFSYYGSGKKESIKHSFYCSLVHTCVKAIR